MIRYLFSVSLLCPGQCYTLAIKEKVSGTVYWGKEYTMAKKIENSRPDSAVKMDYKELNAKFNPNSPETSMARSSASSLHKQFSQEKDRVLENPKHKLKPMGPMTM